MAIVDTPTLPVTELSGGFQQRTARGRAARTEVPRASHAAWVAQADRADPVTLLEEQAANRVPELVPIRYGRMMVSPFTFYRGAALIMAADLSTTPTSGIIVQLCGDAHLSNFGMFGSPERTLVFDINDFDETLPGPWEWDVKRLAASFEIAGRNRKFSDAERRANNLEVAKGYRERMRISAASPVMNSWYSHLSADDAVKWVRDAQGPAPDKKQVKRTEAMMAKARTKDSMSAFTKLVRVIDGELRIVADPPLIVPIEDLVPVGQTREEDEQRMRDLIANYQTTLIAQHHPIHELEYLHMARKVVGVGSVGTRAWIILMRGRDDGDPVLLQAKEAQESVLARFVGASAYEHQGERVVRGQRMMQSSSDIFLGWQEVEGFDAQTRHFYIRQLHDWKGSVDVELIKASGLKIYARMCGETLARAHARSGDRVAIAAYLGKSNRFDQAIADFSAAYADQNDKDYAAFVAAVASGRLEAQPGL
jgi:uncharacterized protein (DUF2252 family)